MSWRPDARRARSLSREGDHRCGRRMAHRRTSLGGRWDAAFVSEASRSSASLRRRSDGQRSGSASHQLGGGAGAAEPTLLMQMAGAARISVGPGSGDVRERRGLPLLSGSSSVRRSGGVEIVTASRRRRSRAVAPPAGPLCACSYPRFRLTPVSIRSARLMAVITSAAVVLAARLREVGSVFEIRVSPGKRVSTDTHHARPRVGSRSRRKAAASARRCGVRRIAQMRRLAPRLLHRRRNSAVRRWLQRGV
jgi:hypothetical protein